MTELRQCPLCHGQGQVRDDDPTAARIGRWASADRGHQRRAALDNWPRSGSQRHRILLSLAQTPLTAHELAGLLRLKVQSVSARLNELWNGGWVQDTGDERPTDTGSQATVWKLSSMGRDQVARHR